ncbi:MAG TPA: hypothetical protein VGI10_27095 [Polyangiaceae bacterium]|jgi:hypothetical protein
MQPSEVTPPDNQTTSKFAGRRLAAELFGGAVLGFTGASLGGPGLISVWWRPLAGDGISCGGPVKEALAQFVRFQLTSALIGCVGIALISFFSRRAWRRRVAARDT